MGPTKLRIQRKLNACFNIRILRLYSYIVKNDAGAAPNPFWGECTLAICKPSIRRTAQVGDWVIGTGSKQAKCNDLKIHNLSGSLVYAMKITSKLSMEDYDFYCRSYCIGKIPNWRTPNWKQKVGDSIYDFEKDGAPRIRRSVHDEGSRVRDLGGLYVLISRHFYYFGEQARPLPKEFRSLIKTSQGHKVVHDRALIDQFDVWVSEFNRNKLYGNPQRRWAFDKHITVRNLKKCV